MKRIGFYFNDKGFSDLDLSKPYDGNNGVGGTQYCFLMLAESLNRYHHSEFETFFYSYHNNILPKGIIHKTIGSWKEAIAQAKADQVDVFLFKAENNPDMISYIDEYKLKSVAWAHNYLYYDEVNCLYNSAYVKRVVFVGHQQYDRYIDHKIIRKAVYIFNSFESHNFVQRKLPSEKIVTYTGSLGKTKGFHLLAFVWKDILKKVPDAQLYVIGSGQLYNRDLEVGPLGVARKEYEKIFAPYLMENGRLLDSVHFLGAMGLEKLDVYQSTRVGVMNPTGETETFGLSGLEMLACGVPVVTRAKFGLLDTAEDGKTGFLIRSKKELKDKIILLLNNDDLNTQIGNYAKEYADTHFIPSDIVKKWVELFEEIGNDISPAIQMPNNYFMNDKKWLRVINCKIHCLGIPTPSILYFEGAFRKIKMRLRKLI